MKSIAQLREKAPYVLKRKGHAKQKKKLLKAYHGNRLKKWWSSYASWECCTIAELKDAEHVGHRMKGGHHHSRNYCICNVCGNWFRKNKGIHEEGFDICDGKCDSQAIYEASLEADVGGGFEPHFWEREK